MTRITRITRWRLVGAAALAASLGGLFADRTMFFAAWLAAWWFCLGIVLGALANGWVHRLTGGAWGAALQPAVRALAPRLPWLLLFFAPVAAGLRALYPWAAGGSWLHELDRPAFAQAWLSPAFAALRFAVYALVAFWLARPAARQRSGGSAALALAVYLFVMSLAAVDLVMSLMPAWYSAVFGWLALVAQMAAGAAVAVGFAARAGIDVRPDAAAPPVWRDLGNLLLMYVLVQAYLEFMQFLIIWAENLPREIAWYVPRLQTGWAGVALALVVLQLVLPLAALLFRRIKDDPRRLAGVAALIVGAEALAAAWRVVPSVDAHGLHGWWLLPLVFAGMGLVHFAGVPKAMEAARGR